MDTSALTIGVVNPKGGSGKTTIAIHLARAVQEDGLSPVLLDTDPQGSAVDWRRSSPEGYDAPPVASVTEPSVLRSDLRDLTASYDVAILDGAAQLKGMTGALLGASDVALIPVQPSGLDLWGTAEFTGMVQEQVYSSGLRAAFVASRRDPRTNLAAEMEEAVESFGLEMLEGTAQRVAYARSIAQGETVLDGYDEKAAREVGQLLEDVSELLAAEPKAPTDGSVQK
jgi:chromosome partitioning protein